ncbi:MAG: DUF2905 domain-containing protein [Chloroflexi bacterium]|nr:MAG: DUF2905 domain-containing protein [Chloroflexota bacterium]RLC85277.1 MAG: DUF2905 domain-containing protein [Chloroflexota bacterium]
METVGKFLVIAGGILLLLGGLVWALSKIPFLGHLPGDVRIEKPGFTCLIPLVSSIVLSILLTVLLNVVIRVVRLLLR